MKALILSVSMLISATAFAGGVASPEQAFLASPLVGEAISELQASGYQDSSPTSTLQVSGSCGFAGCSATYLVGLTLSTKGVNTQTTSVMALVKFDGFGKAVVTLANVQ